MCTNQYVKRTEGGDVSVVRLCFEKEMSQDTWDTYTSLWHVCVLSDSVTTRYSDWKSARGWLRVSCGLRSAVCA